jgi:DNA-binding LacI/PurR family transcriptional regulator
MKLFHKEVLITMNIYDIAKEANVSITTVSRVLNGHKVVKEETLQRVMGVIDKYNYRPSVVKDTADTIAIFTPKDMLMPNSKYSMQEFHTMAGPYFTDILQGISQVVFERDYNLEIAPLHKVPQVREEFARFCRVHHICGAIFVLTTMKDKYLVEVTRGFPVSVVGNRFENMPSVRSDNENGAYGMIKHLLELGHKRIAVIAHSLDYLAQTERIKGCKAALDDAGLMLKNEDIIVQTHSVSTSQLALTREIKNMLNRKNPPTAIMGMNSIIVSGLYKALNDSGYQIPEDISVAGFDDDVLATSMNPPLTTVRQPVRELGQIAAEQVLALIESDNSDGVCDENVILPTEVILRSSTAKAPIST